MIGTVYAVEVNATSAWLDRLTRERGLPEKLFVLHQFRSTMVRNIERVADRPILAEVLHADGFGTRRQKLATYRVIARPAPVHDGLQALLRRGRTPLPRRRRTPDPAAGAVRQLPVTRAVDMAS